MEGSAQNAKYQGICSWMLDPLAADPESRCHFLQCQPAPNNLFCGRWQRMPCAPATVFDLGAQVCVWDSRGCAGRSTPLAEGVPGPLPPPGPPSSSPAPQFAPMSAQAGPQLAPGSSCLCPGGVKIGSCNANFQCPGQSVCQVGQSGGERVSPPS